MSKKDFSLSRLARTFGSVVEGVVLKSASETVFEGLKEALRENRLLVIPKQDLDDPADLMKVAKSFGQPMRSAFSNGIDGCPEVVKISRSADQVRPLSLDWHADSTYLNTPPRFSMMYALNIPEIGGNTLFCDTTAAFDDLSDKMKKILLGLNSVNVSDLHSYNDRSKHVSSPTKGEVYRAVHPAIRIHEETGRKAVYANEEHTLCFDGLTLEESRPILDFLHKHITQDKYITSVDWKEGTFAIWDNRGVQHRAVDNYQGERRDMFRVILER